MHWAVERRLEILGDELLAEQQFSVTEDLAAKAHAAQEKVKAEADARAEESKRQDEQKRLALKTFAPENK